MANAQIKNKIIQSLRAVGLTAAQIKNVTPKLVKNLNIINRVNSDSPFWDVNKKTEQASTNLGIDKTEYIVAALKQPQLFYQAPETINSNIEQASKLIGIDKAEYIKAALKQPSLFCQAPKTIHRNARTLTTAWEKGYIKEDNLKDAFLKNPGTLTSAPNNTLLRSLHANFTKQAFGLSNFIKGRGRNKKIIEAELVGFMTDHFNRTGKGISHAIDLHKQGVLSRLPAYAQPHAPT